LKNEYSAEILDWSQYFLIYKEVSLDERKNFWRITSRRRN
jgi:hypothetical protein